MKNNVKRLAACIGIPLIGGGIIGLIVQPKKSYAGAIKPPLSPPPALFPIVWSILYILMGISLYLVLSSGAPENKKEEIKRIFASQLILNFLWPIIFFAIKTYWAAVICLVLLICFVILLYIKTGKISKTASNLLLPYIIWCLFALYLNIGTAILN